MSLLLGAHALSTRAAVAAGPLAPLADGLTSELTTLLERDLYLPQEKALLSRVGGRCERDGATLEFDPFSPHRHRCPVCGETYGGVLHDRFWVFWYQLWLVERAVHAALLARLRGETRLRRLAEGILDRYCETYLLYPNRDNVLGPTRLFFSTYLESIWLLNLCIAVDLLEEGGADGARLGARARERIIEPAAAIIAEYDEGASNRQVWNDVALIAANRLLGASERVEDALFGRSGVIYHLRNNLLPDGTWYEGENYHLFAHRGLWYGVTMALAMGAELPKELLSRFQEGFATPFLTALPDFTLPSRRDSQYAISLRQPRFAELAELGLARQDGDGDARLRTVLYRLYYDDVPRSDTGRARTTADVERNLPGTSLSRADLSWRSLLFARPELPALHREPLGTVLLDAQGVAVFRRADEQVYVALDYGASGGGHGHPDRLNVLLSDGPVRWLDDMGTGSYVDPSVHWYRSTLAHNAPLFNGYEQQRVDGELLAFEDRGQAGWVSARAFDLYPGVSAMRTVVVMTDYVLEELVWRTEHIPLVVDLPIHVDSDGASIGRAVPEETRNVLLHIGERIDATLADIDNVAAVGIPRGKTAFFASHTDERHLDGFVIAPVDGVLYRVVGPGPPGVARKAFMIFRTVTFAESGWVRGVWSWNQAVESVRVSADGLVVIVKRRDGSRDRHRHIRTGWRVDRSAGMMRTRIDLGGIVRRPPAPPRPRSADEITPQTLRVGRVVEFQLGRDAYRRSEQSWEGAGQPTATIRMLLRVQNHLTISVRVRKAGALTFVPPDAVNPYDNESPDINGDGVQLYFAEGELASAWVLVPEPKEADRGTVRIRAIDGWTSPLHIDADWRSTPDGYELEARVVFAPGPTPLEIGVVINEKPPDRERRRGQLVLGGRPGFVYLRGDREDREQLPRFIVER